MIHRYSSLFACAGRIPAFHHVAFVRTSCTDQLPFGSNCFHTCLRLPCRLMTLQRGTTRRFDAHGYVKFGLLFAWQNCVRRSKDGFWAGDSADNLPAVEALIVFQPLTQYNMKWAGFSCREQNIIFVYICHLERSSTFTYAIYAQCLAG